jgi:hypothetical protein
LPSFARGDDAERKQGAQPRIGIGLDEPIEVSPGQFRTARSFIQGAKGPKAYDEYLRVESLNNPELAETLKQSFGWKDGAPAQTPVITQIIDNAHAETDYIMSVIGDEPFEASYEQGASLAVKLSISKNSKIVLHQRKQ